MSCPQFTGTRGCHSREKLIQRDSKEQTHTHTHAHARRRTHPDVNLSNVQRKAKGGKCGYAC